MAKLTPRIQRIRMGQVFVACKKCGTRFSTRKFVDREAFNERKLEPGSYECPACEATENYTVNDYEYSD